MEVRSPRTKCEGHAELGCTGKRQEVTLEEWGLVSVRRGKSFKKKKRNYQLLKVKSHTYCQILVHKRLPWLQYHRL